MIRALALLCIFVLLGVTFAGDAGKEDLKTAASGWGWGWPGWGWSFANRIDGGWGWGWPAIHHVSHHGWGGWGGWGGWFR